MSTIGIIDYGVGNLRSVQKALESVGAPARILAGPSELDGVTHLILPGVGAFADGMAMLRDRGWVDPVKAYVASGRAFLGICLGMQLVFEGSEEDAPSERELVPGLGLVPGKVVRFRAGPGERLKVPHMGWNNLTWQRDDPLLRGLPQQASVYFVHSYYALPAPAQAASLVSARAEYPAGRPFCATIWRGNLWATQFHPEKSQRVGMQMLANFAAVPSR